MRRRAAVVAGLAACRVPRAVVASPGVARSARSATPRAPARNVELARIGLAVGSTYATTGARKLFASAERRAELDDARRLRSAEQVAERLGNMKGALMKVGQMASYLDDGLPEPVRQALAALQADAPPMSAELAAEVVERELGRPPDEVFVEWDPDPIAAASIGQVHRAVAVDPASGEERAVAVKVQYPGVGEAIEADLANTDLLGTLLRQGFGGLDPTEMVAEIKERVAEELDYRREAANQSDFADFYRGHPFIHVPAIMPALSTAKVLTSELVVGAPWREVLTWDQHRARPRRRGDLPLRVPQPVPDAGVQRRSAPRQLPVPRRRSHHVPRLRARPLLQRRRAEDVRLDGPGGRRRPRRRRRSGASSRTPACCGPAPRCRRRRPAPTSRSSTSPSPPTAR